MLKILIHTVTRTLPAMVLAGGLMLGVSTARADNVPGSSGEAIGYIAFAGTDQLIGGIAGDIRKLRGDDRQTEGLSLLAPDVSQDGGQPGLIGLDGIVRTESGLSVIGSLSYRNLVETGALDYDIFAGSLLLGYHTGARTLVFGGLIGERGDGVTPPNSGTIAHSGFGGVVGIDYAISDRVYLTAMAGKIGLSYDITRSSGAISGSFGADRRFVVLSGEVRLVDGKMATVVTSGLRYVAQDTDAYSETGLGGGNVAAMSGQTVSAMIGSRSTFNGTGLFKPYVEADLRYDLSQDMVLPGLGDTLPDGRAHGRLGLGLSRDTSASTFEAGVGANFGDGGYNGIDANLRLTLRF